MKARLGRSDHACALLDNGKIIVVGGYAGKTITGFKNMYPSEIFSLDTLTWNDGPEDPETAVYARWTAVPHNGTILLVEHLGDSKWIWRLNQEEGKFEQFLDVGINTGYPIALPANYPLSCGDDRE